MAVNHEYLGRLTETISQQVIPSLGIVGAPLNSFSYDFSAEGATANSYATISTSLGVPKGRQSYWLNTTNRKTYNDYTDPATATGGNVPPNYGEIVDQEFKIYPQMVKEGFQSFAEQELSNLRDPAYIRGPLREQVVETVRRQVWAECLRRILDPLRFVDIKKTTGTTTLVVSPSAYGTDYGEFGVNEISEIETQLFNNLIPTEGLSLLLNGKLYDGISEKSPNLNWANYSNTLAALTDKKYMQLKNFAVHRVHLVDGAQDLQPDGLDASNGATNWPNVKVAKPGSFTTSYTPPARPGEEDATKAHTTGAITFGDAPNADGTDAAPTLTSKFIGVGLHKRALGIAAFREFSETEFAGVNLGAVQTSFFTDPLTGFPFRLMLYYRPELQRYQLICSAKIGFVTIDPLAAVLIFKT